MKFIIQCDKNQHIYHDFSWQLVQSLDFLKWRGTEFDYILSETLIEDESLIPVGSVEFVLEHLKHFYDIEIKPINVPEELRLFFFCKRRVENNIKHSIKTFPWFVKSAEKFKDYTYIIKSEKDLSDLKDDHLYQISHIIDIISEWRCFVFKGVLVGLQYYSGDFTKFPDVEIIKKMISAWDYKGPAYTIDVGINDHDTFVIECHDFFSCGLYGFSNMNIIPYMFLQTYHYLKNYK